MSGSGTFGRTLELTRAARRTNLLRVLREIGVVGHRQGTREGAIRFRQTLEELGPTFVKLGQLLAGRPDLIPDVYVEELSALVDDVAPLPFAPLREVIEREIGFDRFVWIDEKPLASASIAQIHPALLDNGLEVVLKVRRPGIVDEIAQDIALLRATAAILERRSATARLLQLEALTDELEEHLTAEVDFREEAHNTELIAGMLEARSTDIAVPRVIRPLVTEEVLVLERIAGERISPAHGLEPERAAELARSLFGSYVEQVAVDGIYHADPHAGNVLVTPDGRLALLDFGLLGRLDEDTRAALALLLLAIAQNRADDVADLILSLSRTGPDADEAGFVHELRRRLPRYHWRPLGGIRVGAGLADLQRLALRHGVALPTAFALVGKTLSQAESIARTLDPQMDPIAQLRSDGRKVLTAEVTRRMEPTQLLAFASTQLEPLLRMPRRISRVVERLETGSLKIVVAPADVATFERLLRSAANRLGAALVIVGLLIASALIARTDHGIAVAGFVTAAVLAVFMVWRIARTSGGV